MYLDILGQYIVVLLQYACHISQYIVIRFWHIVTALPVRLEPTALQTRVKHFTTEALPSPAKIFSIGTQRILDTGLHVAFKKTYFISFKIVLL